MIRERRKALRLTQKEVAKLLGISNSKLSLIENRHCTDLHLSLTLKICNLFGFSIYKFIEWLESNPK